MGCNCGKKFYGGGGFGLGMTTDQSGQTWLDGKKVVGWNDDMPMTQDDHGNLFANILNMNTGTYMPGVQMPTTIAARGGGRGPIATAPTGSGRTFWAPAFDPNTALISFCVGAVVGVVVLKVFKLDKALDTVFEK